MPDSRTSSLAERPAATRQAIIRQAALPSRTEAHLASLARQRTEALARLCGLNPDGATFVGEAREGGSLAVVAVRGGRIVRRWRTADAGWRVEVIPVGAITAVRVAGGPGLARTITVRALNREIDYEFDFAEAQAFNLALAAVLDSRVARRLGQPDQREQPGPGTARTELSWIKRVTGRLARGVRGSQGRPGRGGPPGGGVRPKGPASSAGSSEPWEVANPA